MKIFKSIDDVQNYLRDGVVVIGNFDGVHLGHQALVQEALREKENKPAAVLTFSPHPSTIIHPEKIHRRIQGDKQKADMLGNMGIDAIIFQPVSKEYLALSPEQFFNLELVGKLGIKKIVVGENFTFGAKAQGDTTLLKALAEKASIKAQIVDTVFIDGHRVSSSAIRECLAVGNLDTANKMLGRPYSFRGKVVKGQGLGGRLGFRTANVEVPPDLVLKPGVYATVARLINVGSAKDFVAATNLGVRPSVSDRGQLVLESHLFDCHRDLNNHEIEVFFIKSIRAEKKFTDVTALQAQVQKDFQDVRRLQHDHPHLFQLPG